ncbi:PqiA/YebS family transporter subunit [Craterilacuibacter sp.]|uniref:PqiA/YebS family transporter subunit n=1 Tax=Craterilacuibacter sp. TaxID=2870909 RepID=UPI003F351A4C
MPALDPQLPAHRAQCPHCDLELTVPLLYGGQLARCPRCNDVLCRIPLRAFDAPLAYALAALVFLLLSFSFPLIGMTVEGVHQQITILSSAETLFHEDFALIADLLLLVLLFTPALFLAATSYVYLALRLQKRWIGLRSATQLAASSRPWMMVDVFALAILVSMIKLVSLAEIQFGLSFWSLLLFSLTLTKTAALIDEHWLNYQLDKLYGEDPAENWQQTGLCCRSCGKRNPAAATRCMRCQHHLSPRRPRSLQLTAGLLVTAALLYIPANIYPIMLTESLRSNEASTILEGVVIMWNLGSYPIAFIIFIASILVPIAKFSALTLLCCAAYARKGAGASASARRYTQLYRITELIGRWSMVDVFVVAILVALVRMGKVMSVYPGIAALSFTGVVIFTMLAAMSFDIRLIWDKRIHKESPAHD